MDQTQWWSGLSPLCSRRDRPVPCRSSIGDGPPRGTLNDFQYIISMWPLFFLLDFQILLFLLRREGTGSWVIFISSLGYRRCPCCLPFDHHPRGWRNFLAGKRQAKSQHVCGEMFAVGARWARGIKEMGIAPHRRRTKPLDSKGLH